MIGTAIISFLLGAWLIGVISFYLNFDYEWSNEKDVDLFLLPLCTAGFYAVLPGWRSLSTGEKIRLRLF